MFGRLFCLLMILVPGPTAAAFADCCEADRSCCAGEAPACPVEPGGECSLTAAPAVATVAAPRILPVTALAYPAHAAALDIEAATPAHVARVLPRTPHSFLLFSPLRN